MIYPTDFNYNFNKSDGMSDGKKLHSLSVSHIPNNRFNNDKSRKLKDYPKILLDPDESTWIRYCNNTTVHGLRYLTDRKIQYTERYV